MYNSKLKKFSDGLQSSHISLSKTRGYPSPNEFASSSSKSDYKISYSSTSGKVPLYGPRRNVMPSHYVHDKFEVDRAKFKVNKFQIMNYKAICNLAMSRNSGYVYVFHLSSSFFKYSVFVAFIFL